MSLIDRTFREKIVLVGVTLPADRPEDTEASLDELSLLVDTAGADEVARVVQRRDGARPADLVGKGKAEETPRRSPTTSTATPWCSTTSCRPRSSSTSRRCWVGRPSIAPR